MKYLDKTGLTYLWGKIKGFVNSHEHPVGSIYITTSSTFNPATQWGGTWEKTAAGRCLIGASSAYPLGSTGGENTHLITADELPPHKHDMSGYAMKWAASGNATHVNSNAVGGSWNDNRPYFANNLTTVTYDNNGVQYTQKSMNNMPAYLVVNIWKRTA